MRAPRARCAQAHARRVHKVCRTSCVRDARRVRGSCCVARVLASAKSIVCTHVISYTHTSTVCKSSTTSPRRRDTQHNKTDTHTQAIPHTFHTLTFALSRTFSYTLASLSHFHPLPYNFTHFATFHTYFIRLCV